MSLNSSIFLASLIAVGSGITIALQSVIISAYGEELGAVRTSFWLHLGGAIMGALVIFVVSQRGNLEPLPQEASRIRYFVLFAIAGTLGLTTVIGVAASFPKTGLVAGQIAILTGQTLFSLLFDTMGWAGREPVPIDARRIVGLVLMAVAAYLLLPRSD